MTRHPATDTTNLEAQGPVMPYLTMGIGGGGLSALKQDALAGFSLGSLGGTAAPIWMRRFDGGPCDVWFTVLPVGWVGEWHESPAYQWVCAVSGSWWIETGDGVRTEFGPGQLHWGADIGTLNGRGHRSGQSGSEPCIQMMVRYRERDADVLNAQLGQ